MTQSASPPPSDEPAEAVAAADSEERDETRALELRLLLEAIFARYHHDFRGYATTSLLRRLERACDVLGCKTLSALQDRVLHDPESLPQLLRYLTVPVSEMFRDPTIDFTTAVYALVAMLFAGSLAGYFPARRAAAIRPIEALRDE